MLGGDGGNWDLGTRLQCGDTLFRVEGLGFSGQGFLALKAAFEMLHLY